MCDISRHVPPNRTKSLDYPGVKAPLVSESLAVAAIYQNAATQWIDSGIPSVMNVKSTLLIDIDNISVS